MFKFLDEAVKYQKCCFYFSIEKGLRVWGIFKTVLLLLLLLFFPIHIYQLVHAFDYSEGQKDLLKKHIVIASFVLVRLIVEFVFHFYFMVGIFKKRIEYLKFYEKHCTTLLLTLMLAGVLTGILFMSEFSHERADLYSFGIFMAICANLVMEFYIDILVTHTIQVHESLPVVVCVMENSEAEDEYTMRIEI